VINLTHFYQKEWEKHFTVVNWDQRASGKTRFESDAEEVKKTITMERMIEDACEVAKYIRKRIGQDRIVVLGQSWGSALGSQLVLKYPELFSAFIGTGQVVDTTKNFQLGYERALAMSEAAGDEAMNKNLIKVKQLEREGKISFHDKEFQKVYISAITKYGIASFKFRNRVKAMLLFLRIMLTSPENTVCEVLQRRFGKKNTVNLFLDFCKSPEFDKWRLDELGTEFAVPYYQINGDNDWQTPYPLAREYYDRVEAPKKCWYTLNDAGHAVQFDNLTDFTRYLIEIRAELFGQDNLIGKLGMHQEDTRLGLLTN